MFLVPPAKNEMVGRQIASSALASKLGGNRTTGFLSFFHFVTCIIIIVYSYTLKSNLNNYVCF